MKIIPKFRSLFGIVPKLDSMRFQIRKMQIDQNLIHCTEMGITDHRYCDNNIIVSLTSYGERVKTAYLAIESIMEQTMKANRIVLWLDNSWESKRLPESLQMLKKRGLEIFFCNDIRSYKKLIPSLKKFPNDTIITIDDDLIFDINILEDLIVPYLENPQRIYCCRAHQIVLGKDAKPIPYNNWNHFIPEPQTGWWVFPTGGGGCLYPPHSLDEEVLNEKVFMDICKFADDVWFKAMALKKGTETMRVETINKQGVEYIDNPCVQEKSLCSINVGGEALNDIQLSRVFEKYNLYQYLKKKNVD